jgi:hypothetical protein
MQNNCNAHNKAVELSHVCVVLHTYGAVVLYYIAVVQPATGSY